MAVVTGLACALAGLETRGQETPNSEKMFVSPYKGWTEGLFFNSPETKVQAVVVPAVGGRILNYSVNTENILFENPLARGKTRDMVKDLWVGGYQSDVGPEVRGILVHDQIWNGAWSWKRLGPFGVDLQSEPDATLGLRLKKKVLFDTDNGDLGLDQVLENTSSHPIKFCLWDRTLCRNGGFAFFPLNPRSRFPAKWSERRTNAGQYTYDGTTPSAPQVKIIDNVLFTETRGLATKIGADSDAGWVAYARGDLLFVKYFPYDPKGDYTDGGNSVEIYFDEAVVELEPLAAERTLKPGEQQAFPEKWSLIYLEKEVETLEDVRKLLPQIPPSPFRR